MKRILVLLVAGGLAAFVMIPGGAWAASWHQQAFANEEVSLIVNNPRNPAAMAAVASGKLYLSLDSGVSWFPSLLPVVAHKLAYDPVYTGRIYAGTGNGLYRSDNGGLSWHVFGDSTTSRKIVTALIVTEEYIYAGMYDGAGTPVRLFRFNREGMAQDMNLPSGNIAALEYDVSRHRLYVGAAAGVYSSDNQGVTWFGGERGAGKFTVGVIAKPGLIWQASADGLYRSNDDGASWNRLAGPGNINGTFYGQDMHISGLAVSGNHAFYGSWSIGFPYRFLVEYDGSAAHSVLNARVFSVAADRTQVWAATANGLWVNDVQESSQPRVQRPVVIIPGFLGSMPTPASLVTHGTRSFLGFWDSSYQTPFVLDPFGHGFDGLIEALEKRGYVQDSTLFAFPYNWTQDNAVTAAQLSRKLVEIRQICQCVEVDIVAHSMGGLVARSYIQSPAYRGDVHNLIQLGTPNAGSVASYEPWESGTVTSFNPNFHNQLLNTFVSALITDQQTAETRVQTIHQFVPSLGQLLPIFNYLTGRSYPIGYPANPFLEQLNLPGEMNGLKQRVVVYTVGASSQETPVSLTVGPERPSSVLWPHGEPLASFGGEGDEVVPFASLESLAKASNVLDVNHHELISAAAPFILQTLLGEYVPDTASIIWPPERYLAIYANGPVALSVTDSYGRTIADTQLEIPGSYYSGSTVFPQIMVVPNYQNGDYHITARGVGEGNYRIGTAEITNEIPVPIEAQLTAIAAPGIVQDFCYDAAVDTLVPIVPEVPIIPDPPLQPSPPEPPLPPLPPIAPGARAEPPIQPAADPDITGVPLLPNVLEELLQPQIAIAAASPKITLAVATMAAIPGRIIAQATSSDVEIRYQQSVGLDNAEPHSIELTQPKPNSSQAAHKPLFQTQFKPPRIPWFAALALALALVSLYLLVKH